MAMLAISRSWIGVVVAIAGNITISLALNCQKLAHTRLQEHHRRQAEDTERQEDEQADSSHDTENGDQAQTQNGSPKHNGHASEAEEDTHSNGHNSNGMDTEFLHSKLWWLGIALMTVGEAGNFISYGFAPASLVAPLGAVALLSNVIISPILLGEKFKASDIGGIFLAIVGAVTVVFSSKQNDVRLNPSQLLQAIKRLEFVIYTAVSVSTGSLLAFLSTTSLGDRWVLIDVGTCAIFGGFTVLSTKGISSLISGGQPIEALKFPITYGLIVVLAVTAVVQITYLNRALQRFDSREVIPTQFVFFTISAIVGSAILYRDFENMDAHRLINFLFGCLTTFAGVFVLTWRHHRQADDQHSADEDNEDGSIEAADESGHAQASDEETAEGEPLLSHSWHGSTTGARTRNDSFGSTTKRPQRIDFLEPAFVERPSNALRVPSSSSNKTSSPARNRPRSRTNSPHTANNRLSGSYERSTSYLSRSASNQTSGVLSFSNSAGLKTPKLSLMSIDRPTGLSAGHYLLMATPPPQFALNTVNAPVGPTAGGTTTAGGTRGGLSRGLSSQYGSIGGGGGKANAPPALPFAGATGAASSGSNQGSKRSGNAQQTEEPKVEVPMSQPTAAESIVTPVAGTSSATGGGERLSSRLVETLSPIRSRSSSESGSSTPN